MIGLKARPRLYLACIILIIIVAKTYNQGRDTNFKLRLISRLSVVAHA